MVARPCWGVGWSVVALCLFASQAVAADHPMADAAKNKDREAVRALLQKGVDVNAAQPDGATALHWAAQWDQLDTAHLLIRAGAKADAADHYGVTPLALASINGSASMIAALLTAGVHAHAVLPSGETALMRAARSGKPDAVRVLLDAGADLHAREPTRGQTALMWAAAEGHADVVRLLLDRGADAGVRSTAGYTPLLFAARPGNVDVARILVSAGADPNETSSDGFTPLMIAIVRSKVEFARFLLEKGADPNKGPGFYPLHWVVGDWADYRYTAVARSEGNEWSEVEGYRGQARLEAVKMLLAYRADPNAPATARPPVYVASIQQEGLIGASPFFVAAKFSDVTVMRLMAAAGASPTRTNRAKTTPLMAALGHGLDAEGSAVPATDVLAAVKLLLELGNDVNAVNDAGDTPLHAALHRGIDASTEVIQFLVDNGANLNAKNKLGWTALAIAEGALDRGSNLQAPLAVFLRKLGAEPTQPEAASTPR